MVTITSKKIRVVMVFKDITGGQLARKLGVSRSAINMVVEGQRRISRLRKFIAKELDLPMSIWTDMDCELKARKEGKS